MFARYPNEVGLAGPRVGVNLTQAQNVFTVVMIGLNPGHSIVLTGFFQNTLRLCRRLSLAMRTRIVQSRLCEHQVYAAE
jgi:hypothetical protein